MSLGDGGRRGRIAGHPLLGLLERGIFPRRHPVPHQAQILFREPFGMGRGHPVERRRDIAMRRDRNRADT